MLFVRSCIALPGGGCARGVFAGSVISCELHQNQSTKPTYYSYKSTVSSFVPRGPFDCKHVALIRISFSFVDLVFYVAYS